MSRVSWKIQSFFSGLVSGLGFFVAVAGELFRTIGWEMPCRNSVCGLIARDPLNSQPPFTPGFFAALYFLIGLLASTGNQKLRRIDQLCSVPAFLIATSLVSYTRIKYGDFCPACLIIWACVTAGVALKLLETDERSHSLNWLGAAISIGCVVLLGLRESRVGLDRLALSTMSLEEVSPSHSWVGRSETGPVIIVDFGCEVCRSVLRSRVEASEPFAVRSVQRSEYDRASARYLSAFHTPRERVIGLKALLADDSFVAEAIDHLPKPPHSANEKALKLDRDFALRIRVEVTPVLLYRNGRHYYAADWSPSQRG